MTLQELKEKLMKQGYSESMIAQLSGVPLDTVQKIIRGEIESPEYETLRALERILQKPEGYFLHESHATYQVKQQGEYTLEDYYKIPDERRVELIDGVIYDMAAPTSVHQLIAGFIYARLLYHVSDKKGECLPMISPLDVQLDCDEKTMVQPDVVIICDRDKIINRCIYGTPDLVMEVLSRSSAKRDSVIKLNKYMNAGVREYWIIDPERLKVIVYNFSKDNFPVIYGFDAKIPVGIWNDECEIDFQEVYEHIRFVYDRKDH